MNKLRFAVLLLALALLISCTPAMPEEGGALSLRFREVELTVGMDVK